MKVSSAWIKEWLRRTMLDDRTIAEALERAGIEVEQIMLSKPIDKKVIVGLVKKVAQHPQADRLKLVEVETGSEMFRVVCGASNVRSDIKVAFAQIGTLLPSGDRIEKATLRGEVSEGMLCSEFELGIGDNHNGIMELSSDAPIGMPVAELYPEDGVLDIKTPANRWDLKGIYGLAREVSAMTTETLLPLAPPPVEFLSKGALLADKLEAQQYSMVRLQVEQAGAQSPRVIAARLRAAGVRSIGPVVDITNYVMLETGQPLHAFDAAKVLPPLAVRRAHKGETLVTLDGVRRDLGEADLIVADGRGPIALAGVMGGKSTEVSADTTEILLESAVFDGVIVRKMAQRHGLRTEASARFEHGLPVTLPSLAAARAVELLAQVVKAKTVEAYEQQNVSPQVRKITLPLARASKVLGFGISHKEAVEALARLGISAKLHNLGILHKNEPDSAAVLAVEEVPWWRADLIEPEDLIEEIVRVIGYARIPSTIPSWRPQRIGFDRTRAVRARVRDIVWAAGAFEVMTYSFVSATQLTNLGLDSDNFLKLKNPLSLEQAYLRGSLLPSHLATLEHNRVYAKAMRFYEISKVFMKRKPGEQPDEPLRLGMMVLEPASSYLAAKGVLDAVAKALNIELDFRALTAQPYAAGRAAQVWFDKHLVGTIGQVHPTILRQLKLEGEATHFEIDLTPLIAAASPQVYRAGSVFPATYRDLALELPVTVSWQAVRAAAAGWDVAFVSDYYGAELSSGMKGMTIRLKLALPDRTPTEAEAAELETAVLARLSHKLGAQRRS